MGESFRHMCARRTYDTMMSAAHACCQLSHVRGTLTRMTSDSVGHTVGENLHRIRVSAGESQAETAQRLQRHGLDWKRDQVAALETGRRTSVGVDELLILSWAYDVPMAEWFTGEGRVSLGTDLDAEREDVRDALSGKRKRRALVLDFATAPDLEADARVAERLGVDQDEVTRIAHELWGHSLTDERNKRLPTGDPKTLRTLRGGMTKRLMREVELYMKEKE